MSASVYQIIDFSGTKKLNKGQRYTFSIYLKSTAACSGTLYLYSYTGAVLGDTASSAFTFTGGEGWRKYSATLTLSTSTANALQWRVTVNQTATLLMDCAMVIQNNKPLNWFTDNAVSATAGTISADIATSGTFNTVGFDCDDCPVIHPWAVVEPGVSIGDYVSEIADATAARYMGIDACGTFKYRTNVFKTGYADPTPLQTISNPQSLDTILDIKQANKVVIHGVYVWKDGYERIVWDASNTNSFTKDSGNQMWETVINGGVWPPNGSTGFPMFYAKYSEQW
jgi:hypothetical protein